MDAAKPRTDAEDLDLASRSKLSQHVSVTPRAHRNALDMVRVLARYTDIAAHAQHTINVALAPTLSQYTGLAAHAHRSALNMAPVLSQYADVAAQAHRSALNMAQMLARHTDFTAQAQRTIDTTLAPMLTQYADIAAQAQRTITAALAPNTAEWANRLALLLETSRHKLWPPNLQDVDFTLEGLSQLADEGIVLWAVPDPETARQFLRARTAGARRTILSRRRGPILDQCGATAAYAAGGRFAPHARELEQAIAAGRKGFVGPALSHLASVLDTMLQTELEKDSRVQLVRHQSTRVSAMNHFEELALQHAMVFRPIWFAYRPMRTNAERAVSTSFSRHAVAHRVTERNVISDRNFVQASMLAAALLNFLSWWSENAANGISFERLTISRR